MYHSSKFYTNIIHTTKVTAQNQPSYYYKALFFINARMYENHWSTDTDQEMKAILRSLGIQTHLGIHQRSPEIIKQEC